MKKKSFRPEVQRNNQWVGSMFVDLFDLDKLGVGLEVNIFNHDKAGRTHWSMKHKNFAVDAALMPLSSHCSSL